MPSKYIAIEMNTPNKVRLEVEKLRKEVGDPESAHSFEDWIHKSTLRAIASGETAKPIECAQAALRTESIKFPRWYA